MPWRRVRAPHARRRLVGLLALFLASVTSCAHADGLFLPVTAQDAPAMPASSSHGRVETASSDPRNAWERRVRVSRHYLASARDDVEHGDPARLLLNIGPGVALDVAVERTARTKRGYTLSGRVEGGVVGFATLVVHDEAVAGSIWTPDAEYELSYLGRGVHALRNVTNISPVECGVARPSELAVTDATIRGAGPDDGSVVDIMVVWTPAAREYAGGEAQVMSQIGHAVAYANDAFDRSGAFVSLNLVGAQEVDYSETNDGADLARLRNATDGHLDGVHDLRDAAGADLVYLLTTSAGGRGDVLGSFSVGGGRASLTTLSPARVFAHEVGHNLGLLHDRWVDGPSTFGHGFVTGALCEQTIMAYGFRCEAAGLPDFRLVPFYSSPWRYSPGTGRPLGVSRLSGVRGPQGPANAVLAINRNRHTVANFRPSRSREGVTDAD